MIDHQIDVWINENYRAQVPDDDRATCGQCGTYYREMLRHRERPAACLCHQCAEDAAKAALYDVMKLQLDIAIQHLADGVREKAKLQQEAASLDQSRREALRSMAAVSDFLQPNWSNDLPWEDEIIIAIRQMVEAAEDSVLFRDSQDNR